MTTKRKKAAPAKRAAKPSTALAKRTRRTPALRPVQMPAQHIHLLPPELPAPPAPTPWNEKPLEAGTMVLGEFALAELKFTAEEEAVLSEPVKFEDMRVKPTGAVYLPHPAYTRWLNRAFGRTGWALREISLPLVSNGTVVVPYMLFVHGKPVAKAWGEQEYFENNKEQSYGDALESTHASALRRCCKHLGLALELWDKSFNDQFLEEHCVQLWKEGEKRPQYRRRLDVPFWWEKKQQRREEPQEQRRERPAPPASATHDHANAVITEAQVKRLWTIIRRAKRTDEEFKFFLTQTFNVDSSKKILRKDYEQVCAAVESPFPLMPPPVEDREPGEDG